MRLNFLKFGIEIGRKGFIISRLPGQELRSITSLLPRTTFDFQAKVNGFQSAIIMACIRWLQRTFPEAPYLLERIDKDGQLQQINTHPLLDLLDQPNPYYDGLLLQMATIADFILDGNAYWLKRRTSSGRVAELWWLPSTTIEPKWPMDGTVFIEYYDYRPGTMQTQRIKPEDIVHFRDGFDPDNIRKGMSSLKSLFREVFTDDEASNMTASLLRNVGVPGLLISPKEGVMVGADDAEATKKWFKESFTGDKRGEPLVMSGATELKSFGFSPKDMTLKELRRIPEERISAVLGVPAIVAGLGAGLDRSTYANYAEAREAAYEGTIIPLQRIISSVLKRDLLKEFEEELTFWRVGYDLSNIRILQEDENKLVERIARMVGAGFLKISDAQSLAGVPVDDSQDYYLRPFNVVAVGSVALQEKILSKGGAKDFDEMGKEMHWRRYVAKAESYERSMVRALKQMFREQRTEAVRNAKEEQRGNLINKTNALKRYSELAMPILTSLMGEAIEDARNMVNGHKAFTVKQGEFLSQAALAWLKIRIGWAAEEMGEETAQLLSNALAEGHAAGMGTDQIAELVNQVFDFNDDVRAQLIARTETIQASAQGSIEGYKDSGVQRLEFYASLDERVCPLCMGLHGTEFPISQTVGIITVHPNCRCRWLPVI